MEQPASTSIKHDEEIIKKPMARKAPIVKQTATSMMRLAKANPLLFLNPNNKLDLSYKNKFIEKPKLSLSNNVLAAKPKVPIQNASMTETVTRAPSFKHPSLYNKPKVLQKPENKCTSILKKTDKMDCKNSDKNKDKVGTGQRFVYLEKKDKKPVTKAILVKPNPQKKISKPNIMEKPKITMNSFVSPPLERKSVSFSTSTAYNRRSVKFFTPVSASKKQAVLTPRATINDLPSKLNEWLKAKGKPLHSFHHLKCFDVKPQDIDEENKENIEIETNLCKTSSYDDLKIIPDDMLSENDVPVQNNLSAVAVDALNDLHKLIIEDYPLDQCEAWLSLIHQKYEYVIEHPQYWECRAAIEQCRGNISSAVECYRTAIIQGAEVNEVDKSLDQLLHKFKLLNISTSHSPLSRGDDKKREEREKILLDARNVFKSTIIQFAVKERTSKKKDNIDGELAKKLLVTPVRRSTRLSCYQPNNIQVCSSMQELDASDRECMTFKVNDALTVRYN